MIKVLKHFVYGTDVHYHCGREVLAGPTP